jgi:tRNA (guanosine-2'-O-)-methyltransferase
VISPRFPLPVGFQLAGQSLTAARVIELLEPFLTPERQARIRTTVDGRTCNITPVLENIYDRGNISAVLRSAEAMGFQNAHVIELNEKFKSSNRVTKGADKWLDVHKWKSTVACTSKLKELGYQILATHLDSKARPIAEMDFTRPTAIVFGNEKDGISPEMIEQCDHTVIIPMHGFVQSFNISVAAAIAFYHIHRERLVKLGISGDLSEEEKLILRADFNLRSNHDPDRLIAELLERKS